MQELIQRLFESSFMPHGHCYLWQPGLVWLQASSDTMMAVAYFMISFLLFWFVRNRKDLAFRWLFALGSVIFALCAVTHVMGVWTIWQGSYWLDGSIRFIAGVGSIATALLFIPAMPKALRLPTPTQLRKANQALEKEIEQRREAEAELAEKARELQQAYEKLQETERLKTEFFANVSHELRTPLTLILSPLETTLEEEAQALSSAGRQRLKTAHNNSIRMLQMVNGLLDFSRLEIGKVEVNREATDVLALTRSVGEDFRPLIEKNQLELMLDTNVENPVVEVDRYLYERILFNLLSNAVKFTPEGGRVEVALTQDNGRLELTVTDTGIGIEEEELESIFKDFRQVDASATRRFEGTGLGLPLVKEFAELLDGYVRVDSSPGEGSTFTVSIQAPVTDQEPTAGRRDEESWMVHRPHAPVAGGGKEPAAAEDLPSVVLAEDNNELAGYIEDLLIETCRVYRAPDGVEAMRLVNRHDPDLVISDIMMPRKDGLTLCRELKEEASTTDIPVVLLTALTDREALLKGWEAGADEYLFKPFHPKEVVTRIRTLLTNIQRRRKAEQETRGLQRELLRISERERRRIGQDLHDGLASHISGVSMLAQSIVEEHDDGSDINRGLLQEIVKLAQEGARQARAMARGLNPVKLDRQGLAAALKTLAETQQMRFSVDCRFEQIGKLPDLSEEEATNLYWIGQEALSNAVKHGEANRILIRFGSEGDGVVLEINDDGPGLPDSTTEREGGMGLQTMRYRADLIGASLTFEENREGGLRVWCRLPHGR